MNLLITLIKRELVDNITSSRYVLTSVLCVVLCLASMVLMVHDYQARINLSISIPESADWEEDVAKPPQPLSLMARGVDEARHIIKEILSSMGNGDDINFCDKITEVQSV